jgi:hypothetical protein
VTTHLRSCARLGLTHFATTLVVCGGFMLLVPAEASAADVAAARTLGFGIVISPDTAPDHQLTAGALDSDDDDSSDDDDDDVVGGGGDAVIAVGSCHAICTGEASSPVHIEVESWVSHTMEGHSLRGPPTLQDRASAADRVIDSRLHAARIPPAAADVLVTTVQSTLSGMVSAGGPDHQFHSGGLDSDDDDSSDDDGDDDVLGGDAAIETGSCELTSVAHVAHFFEADSIPPVFVTSDGHSLRAPPQYPLVTARHCSRRLSRCDGRA